tara:strand:+ start:9648 stop:9950 length:303 start_codon:yes stop_codon:yes gene_type:complete
MKYILVRSDRDLSLTYEFISYSERNTTKTLEYKGRVYCGLELKTKPARDYAIMIGWSDITTDYEEWKSDQDKIEVEEKPKKKTTTRKKTTSRKKTTTKSK